MAKSVRQAGLGENSHNSGPAAGIKVAIVGLRVVAGVMSLALVLIALIAIVGMMRPNDLVIKGKGVEVTASNQKQH